MNVPVTNTSEMNVSVKISAPVNPTEMQEKVEKAISNFFPVELKLQDLKYQHWSAKAILKA